MRHALARHDALARAAVDDHSRHRRQDDRRRRARGVRRSARRGRAPRSQLQRALADPAATAGIALRVRCGLHAGVVERRDNDYFGSAVNRAARIMSAAHGGQMLLSQAVVGCVRERLPAGVTLRDLGRCACATSASPEHVYQVVHPRSAAGLPGAALARSRRRTTCRSR